LRASWWLTRTSHSFYARNTAFLSENFSAVERERSVEDQLDFSPNEIAFTGVLLGKGYQDFGSAFGAFRCVRRDIVVVGFNVHGNKLKIGVWIRGSMNAIDIHRKFDCRLARRFLTHAWHYPRLCCSLATVTWNS